MTVLNMVQTDAGKNLRANILAGQSASVAYVEFGSARYTPTTGQTALTTPFSPPIRFTETSNVRPLKGGLAAGLIGVYHVLLRDLLPAAYVVGEVGLFLTDPATNQPVLTDVYSSPGPGGIFGKGQGSTAAWDIVLALEDGTVDVDFPTPAFSSLNASPLPTADPAFTDHLVGEQSAAALKPTRRFSLQKIRDLIVNSIPAAAPPFAAGMIMPYGGTTVPSGWSACDGAALNRVAEADLYAAIGTTWGSGDGSTTFNKPDLRGRTLAGADARATPTLGASLNAVGETGGAAEVALTVEQMPSHRHSFRSTGNLPPSNDSRIEISNGTGTIQSTYLGLTGGGQAHPNVQPTAIVNYIIKL